MLCLWKKFQDKSVYEKTLKKQHMIYFIVRDVRDFKDDLLSKLQVHKVLVYYFHASCKPVFIYKTFFTFDNLLPYPSNYMDSQIIGVKK